MEKGRRSLILDLTTFKDRSMFRIGRTSKDDLKRPKSQQSYLPFKTELFLFYSNDYTNLETRIHRFLKEYKLNGDWYNYDLTKIIPAIINDDSVFKVDFPTAGNILRKQLLTAHH
jgi:hypothetical protein